LTGFSGGSAKSALGCKHGSAALRQHYRHGSAESTHKKSRIGVSYFVSMTLNRSDTKQVGCTSAKTKARLVPQARRLLNDRNGHDIFTGRTKALHEILKTLNQSLTLLMIVFVIVLKDWSAQLIMIVILFLIRWLGLIR
jgi:hypothetical protein